MKRLSSAARARRAAKAKARDAEARDAEALARAAEALAATYAAPGGRQSEVDPRVRFYAGTSIGALGRPGSLGWRVAPGPFIVPGYRTVANGTADRIVVREGEVAAEYRHGDPYSFAGVVVGPREAVVAFLGRRLARHPDDHETREALEEARQ